jgi:hypothetical protein
MADAEKLGNEKDLTPLPAGQTALTDWACYLAGSSVTAYDS